MCVDVVRHIKSHQVFNRFGLRKIIVHAKMHEIRTLLKMRIRLPTSHGMNTKPAYEITINDTSRSFGRNSRQQPME